MFMRQTSCIVQNLIMILSRTTGAYLDAYTGATNGRTLVSARLPSAAKKARAGMPRPYKESICPKDRSDQLSIGIESAVIVELELTLCFRREEEQDHNAYHSCATVQTG